MKKSGIDILLNPVNRFIKNETTGGILLFSATIIALVWANSPWSKSYEDLWHIPIGVRFGGFVLSEDLHHWINDGLMAVFFFVIGLELKREFIGGELSSFRNAVLPVAAGFGGMLIPAAVFLFLNYGKPTSGGWGIPMATDIAFVLGILALLGKRIPITLKVFLTALAIADDIGAVIVIALFYTSDISLINVGLGAGVLIVMMAANLLGVRSALFYGIMGIGGLWLAFMLSGVHATIAGVLAAFAIPARTRINESDLVSRMTGLLDQFKKADPNNNALLTSQQAHIIEEMKVYSAAAETPLQRLEHAMHPLVAFVIMPVFALANAGFRIDANTMSAIFNPLTMGIFLGLVAGKFIGISAVTRLMVMAGVARLPQNTTWRQIYGAALLSGVGFTMSLFITGLAFSDADHVQQSKIGILIASLVAGIAGYLVLMRNPVSPGTLRETRDPSPSGSSMR